MRVGQEAPAFTGARQLLLSGQRCDLPELFREPTGLRYRMNSAALDLKKK